MFARFLSWIRSWFARVDRLDIYKPHQRMIYSYWDGGKIVKADPMVLYKKIMARGPEISIAIKIAHSISKDAAKGHEDVLDAIREIFDIEAWNFDARTGLTEVETFELLDHFMSYCDAVKKNSNLSPTSSNSSEESNSSSEENPPTENSSVYGCVESESKTDEVTSSPSECASPTDRTPASTTSDQ